MADDSEYISLYPFSTYSIISKDAQPEEDSSVIARLARLEEQYIKYGPRRTREAVLLCHEHGHPHVLSFQIANSFYKLPGDYLPPDDHETNEDRLFSDILDRRLAPKSSELVTDTWNIGQVLARWYRPNLETFMYPYLPAHCTRPKEIKTLHLVVLPSKMTFAVPKNMKLMAIPLMDLYDSSTKHGPQLAALPHLLSRYKFEFIDSNGKVLRRIPPVAKAVGNGITCHANQDDDEHEPLPSIEAHSEEVTAEQSETFVEDKTTKRPRSEAESDDEDDEVDMKHIKAEIGKLEQAQAEKAAMKASKP